MPCTWPVALPVALLQLCQCCRFCALLTLHSIVASPHYATTAVHYCCCCSQVVGREWSDFFGYAMATGWVPIGVRDGGGGTHHKLRRTLPHSGTVQTCMVASSSSDATRGIKNAAAALRRYDRELVAELEAAAAAADAQAAGAGGSRSSRVAGSYR
jgi:hypothetical protein